MNLLERIEQAKIIPIITLENAEDILPLCQALKAGGLEVAEITFRTAAAKEALQLVKRNFPEFTLGAGTILTLQELKDCREAGAQFGVSPGLNPTIVYKANEQKFPFFPGICTPTEIETALELGCTVLKFFPAEALGGTKFLKAIYEPYKHRGVRFIPTGGINENNFKDYLSLPGVLAVGGSWLAARALIKEKAWGKITEMTRTAVAALTMIQSS